jgi:ATP-binding cassette subfamily F protein 3
MITLSHVSLRRGAKLLLDDASVTLNPGEKVALVGRNGAGKSSLFALLNGSLHEDAGQCRIPAQWGMAQVAQDMPETDQAATDFVIEGDQALVQARTEAVEADASGNGERIALAHMRLADAGEHDARSRAQALILGLGFQTAQLSQAVNSFSGGWRMRLQLARALMCPSDLLLLDEPTNHLDLDALVWLESWLQRYSGTLLVISHDREFLDAITQVTLHIDAGKLTRYSGNYSQFERLRAEQMTQQQIAYARQQDRMAHLQKFIDRFKAKATKAKQAQSRVKALERMEKIGPLMAQAEFSFEFSTPEHLPNPMLSLRDVCVGYGGSPPKVILQHVQRSVLPGQRIGILGANGQGKSTLVKTIARELGALSGTVTEGKGLHIGYFAQQELDVLRPDDTPLEHMTRLAKTLEQQALLSGQGTREQDLRNVLGQFNFGGDMVHQRVGTMSGGEKARLVLCMMVWQRPNLLLLDEPTNHLDLDTREALGMALNAFEGTVMLVSHDRALLRSVCDEFWLVSQGEVSSFDGDLDDYQQHLLDEAKRLRQEIQAAAHAQNVANVTSGTALSSRDQRREDAQRRQQLLEQKRPLKKELTEVEKRLETLEAEKNALHAQLMTELTADGIAQAGRRLKEVEATLEELESRWMSLSESLQALEQAS